MRNKILYSIAVLSISFALLQSCDSKQASASVSTPEITNDSLIKKGAYLVAVMGCDDCHSPKTMGPRGPEIIADLRFSGFQAGSKLPTESVDALKNGWHLFNGDLTAAVGPWGTSYSANISGDETGIGNWNEEQFRKAIQEGKWKGMDGGRMLQPPMPWPNYAKLERQDVKAIFAYLKSTKPVKNVVPASIAAAH